MLPQLTPGLPGLPHNPKRSATAERNARARAIRSETVAMSTNFLLIGFARNRALFYKTSNEKEDKPRQGVVASLLKLHRDGAVRCIVWLGYVGHYPTKLRDNHDNY